MIGFVFMIISAAAMQPESANDPFGSIGDSTPDGATRVVEQLLQADAKTFGDIAPHLAIMLAPDFAFPLTHEKFREAFADCSEMKVLSSRPMPRMEKPQAVRITMTCKRRSDQKSVEAIADVMADNEHAFLILPGGVERVWPEKGAK